MDVQTGMKASNWGWRRSDICLIDATDPPGKRRWGKERDRNAGDGGVIWLTALGSPSPPSGKQREAAPNYSPAEKAEK